ncbi:hypothetical protein PAMA_013751 [Pampus argenteus]
MQRCLFLLMLMCQCSFFTCHLYEYHFVTKKSSWEEAQQFCRKRYTDLITMSNMADISNLPNNSPGWIGLRKLQNNKWHWSLPGVEFNESKVILIKENKTWEEALYYCRKHHNDLVSITNLDEQRWVQETAKNASSPYIWLGLRYTCTLEFWFWQSQQPIPDSTPPSSGEDYELHFDTYLLRDFKESPKAGKELEEELASVASSAQLYPEEEKVVARSLSQPGVVDRDGVKWEVEVDKLFRSVKERYLCHYEMDPHKVKALLRSCSSSQTTDEVKVYSEVGIAIVVGKQSQVNARLMDVEDRSCVSEKQTSFRRLGKAKLSLLWEEIEHSLQQDFPGVKGDHSMKAPPPRAFDPTDCFESLVNNQQQPSMFVIFHDDQAYPEYLITFN